MVNALSIIVEGSTCDIIYKDYSPAMLDSFYSPSDSGDSEDDMQGFEFEGEFETESSSASTSISQMSQMIVRQPPSPPIQCISSSSSSSCKLYDESSTDSEAQNEGSSEIPESKEELLNA